MELHLTRVIALHLLAFISTAAVWTAPVQAADWTQFRGKVGLGISDEKNIPTTWSSTENIVWKTAMPGPGASSPITLGDRVFITCYTGYGIEPNQGTDKDLLRHVLCLNRKSGKISWKKEFQPKLPEHKYQGEGSYHGYAASTPTTDGKHLYVFFGKTGVFCLDLDGNQIWHATVGEGTNGWGSGTSPLLYKDLVIINASVESGSLLALNKADGKEVWRAKGINAAWNTPVLVPSKGSPELIVSVSDRVLSFDPDKGEPKWQIEGIHRYVCPSVVYHDDVVFAIGGGHTSLAVRTGGSGDVAKSHGMWRLNKGANVSSPIFYEGHLYWTRDGDTVCCQNPATGQMIYEERFKPGAGRIWSSPVLADGKLYYVSQNKGTFVVAAQPKFELLANNVFQEDDSRTNGSPAISNGHIFLRTDKNLYCIGAK